jgi:hypothetical protein
MPKLLCATTVAGASLLLSGVTQAQCPCGNGYDGYGPAYYGSAPLSPGYYGYGAPAYYAYAAPAYYGYNVGVDAYYRGWDGYGVAGASVRREYYGYDARVDVNRLAYRHHAIGAGRMGWRAGYPHRPNAHRHGLTPPPPATFDLRHQRPTQEGAD